MSIRAGFDSGETATAAPPRPKIRATLQRALTVRGRLGDGHAPHRRRPNRSRERVAAFWNFDEDARRAMTPWRYPGESRRTVDPGTSGTRRLLGRAIITGIEVPISGNFVRATILYIGRRHRGYGVGWRHPPPPTDQLER